MHEQFVKKSFTQAALTYCEASFIQQEIGSALFKRLQYYTLEPKRILDLGAGISSFSRDLKKRYPKAEVIACDFSHSMLKENKPKRFLGHKRLCANAKALPLTDDSIDLIFANQMVEWCVDLNGLFKELNRVLRVDGLLLFSSLGPDTFSEFRTAWQSIDNTVHVHSFVDFHDLGDELVRTGFSMPVLDCEEIGLQYSSFEALIKELRAQGVKNISAERFRGLTTPRTWQKMVNAYESFKTSDGKVPLSYEVIYGQAFKGKKREAPSEHTFSLDKLKKTTNG